MILSNFPLEVFCKKNDTDDTDELGKLAAEHNLRID